MVKMYKHKCSQCGVEFKHASVPKPNEICLVCKLENEKKAQFPNIKTIREFDEVIKEAKEFRKKPIVIKAKELTEDCFINTKEGKLYARAGKDILIQGVEGEIYPCDISIFNKTYDEVKK